MFRSDAGLITLVLLGLVGCQIADRELAGVGVADSISDPASVSPPALPPPLTAVQLQILRQWDEEGGVLTDPVRASPPPGPYLDDGVVYADARAIRDLLSPSTKVDTVNGFLSVGGTLTTIPVRHHGDAPYIPVELLTAQLDAFTHVDRGIAVIYPVRLLCEIGRDARPGAPVFDSARAAGFMDGCPQ
jgi:hypothetical protein